MFFGNFEGHIEKHVLLMRRLLGKRHAARATNMFANSGFENTGFRRDGGASKSIVFRFKRASGSCVFFVVGLKEGPKSRFQVFVEGS